jgi:hypothetical protein
MHLHGRRLTRDLVLSLHARHFAGIGLHAPGPRARIYDPFLATCRLGSALTLDTPGEASCQ